MTFNPNVPTGLVPLDQDYLSLKSNNQALDNVFGVDHTKFSNSTSQKGYHTVIHCIDNTTNPTAVAGTGEYYAKTVGSNIEAFYRSASGIITQLTGPNATVQASNGYTWIPGGILLQWGSFNPNSSINVTFPISFTTVYNVQLTGSANNNSTFRNGISTGTLTSSGFTWEGTVSSHWNPIYWFAIGK